MDISLRDIMARRRLRAMSASPRPERLDAFLLAVTMPSLVLLALYEGLYLTNKLLGILFRPSEVLLIGTQSMVPSEYRL